MHASAVLAQLVARRLGKAEVGGSSPLDSFKNEIRNIWFFNQCDIVLRWTGPVLAGPVRSFKCYELKNV